MTPVVMLVVVTVNLLCTAATGGAETQEATHVVCLSKSDNATFNFTFAESCESKKLMILDHAGREVLQWSLPCEIKVDPKYAERVKTTCDPSPCLLRLTLLKLTEKDSGTFQCRDGAMIGPIMPQYSVRLEVIDVPDLKRSCSYSSSDRTLRCDDVIPNVLVYRKGEHSDRVVRYLTAPFQFQLGGRERGVYVATKEDKTEGDALCTNELSFQVESDIKENAKEVSNQVIIGVSCILFVFLIVFVTGIDILIKPCCTHS